MADSLLIHPDNWPEMTYMEVVQMLFLASSERCRVCDFPTGLYYSTVPNVTDHTLYLKAISLNLKKALAGQNFTGNYPTGYLNDNVDISLQSIPLDYSDIAWNMADMLSDIGDPSFLDYSTGTSKITPPPQLAGLLGYRSTENLIQYYNIIIRLKTPFITFIYLRDQGLYGTKDDGIHHDSTPNSNPNGRESTLDLSGVVGSFAGDALYIDWSTGGETDHDADYNLLYPFPPNDGTTQPDSDTINTLTENVNRNQFSSTLSSLSVAFRSRVQWLPEPDPPFTIVKYAQGVSYERVKASIDYSGIVMDGVPSEVRWISRTANEAGGVGVIGNPYTEGQLFFTNHPISSGVTTDIYFGDYPSRPATIHDPSTKVGTGYTPYIGFQFLMDKFSVYESWDYDGGFVYRTPDP